MAHDRVLHATLDLLDRQLRDRNGVLCGNVDDVEIEIDDASGQPYVASIVTGPGALAYRLGLRRLGTWLERASTGLHDAGDAPLDDRIHVPIEFVTSIGPTIELAIHAKQLASYDTEQWWVDHVITHIPGNDSRATE